MKYLLFISLSILCFLSCTKKDACKEQPIAIKHFEDEYGCPQTKYTLSIDLNNEVVVIRTKESYDTQVTGTCHPDVNFSLYDLVIGKRTSPNENDTIIYDYKKTCPDSKLTLTIDVVQSFATRPDNVTFHALIPKLGNGESLSIVVNLK